MATMATTNLYPLVEDVEHQEHQGNDQQTSLSTMEKKCMLSQDSLVLCSGLCGRSTVPFTFAEFRALLRSSFVSYACFLVLGGSLYLHFGGDFSKMEVLDSLGYLATVAEGLGLLSLRRKIELQKSVRGISGVSMSLYAVLYLVRGLMLPPLTWNALDAWAVKFVELVSLVMVLDVNWSVFVRHKGTYLRDLDTLRAKHIVPWCVVLAFLCHPDIHREFGYTIVWSFTLYLDTVALMPQVVMMSKGGGLVEAPISHFVAATALSRALDLYFWFHAFDAVGDHTRHSVNYSGWLIVAMHVAHELLVTDFLYYYLKARCALRGFSEDLPIPSDIDYECV